MLHIFSISHESDYVVNLCVQTWPLKMILYPRRYISTCIAETLYVYGTPTTVKAFI